MDRGEADSPFTNRGRAPRDLAAVLLTTPLVRTLAPLLVAPARLRFGPAATPDRVREKVEGLHGRVRVVALDHEFAGARAALVGLVADHDPEAGAGGQRGRERVVDQIPVVGGALEADARDVQRARAEVADRDRLLRRMARLDAAEAGRAADRDRAPRRLAGDLDRGLAAGSSVSTLIVADAAPRLDGAKRIGNGSAVPGATLSGYASTSGATNALEDELMSLIVSMQSPAFATSRG